MKVIIQNGEIFFSQPDHPVRHVLPGYGKAISKEFLFKAIKRDRVYVFSIHDRSDKAKEVVQEIIEQAEEEVGYKPPKYAFDLQIMMLPDEGLVLVLSEKEPLENKSGAQLLQALQEMKRVFEEKKAEIGAAEKKAQAGENAGESGKKNKKAAEAQKPQFAIFAFRNIGRVIEYAAVLPTNLRIDSTLYRMEDGTCYAYVRKGGASYERYSRACIQAMEFAALYAADEQKLRYLEEHGECLIREKALKKLRV